MVYKMIEQNQNFKKLYLTFQSYFFPGSVLCKGFLCYVQHRLLDTTVVLSLLTLKLFLLDPKFFTQSHNK